MGSKDDGKVKRRVKVYVKRAGSKAGSKAGKAPKVNQPILIAAVKNERGKYDITGISFLRKFKKHRELAMGSRPLETYMNSKSYVDHRGVAIPAPVIPADADEVFVSLRKGEPLDNKTREVVDGMKQAMVALVAKK